jgi:hypothetical protein
MLFHLCIHLRILIDKAIFIRDDLVPLTNNITGTTSEALTGFPSEAPELNSICGYIYMSGFKSKKKYDD